MCTCSNSRAVLLDLLEENRSLRKLNKEQGIKLGLLTRQSPEELSALMVEARRDLDETRFEELLPIFKAEEIKFLVWKKNLLIIEDR